MNNNINFIEGECLKRKRKPKAWCGDCFQFFEYGPNAKICKEHLTKGKCNLVECRKKSLSCVRKFPNTNSENRHTYCITKIEVDQWDNKAKLRDSKKRSETKFEEIKNEFLINNSVNISNNNNIVSLIDTLDNLQFSEGEKEPGFEDDLLGQFNNIYFNESNKVTIKESKGTQTDESLLLDDDIDLDKIFEMIYKSTKIPKGVLNKLKSLFKRKGIFTGKILKLLIKSNKAWTEDFKKQCPQIEGIALYLENILN
jgi:hypothetical protein